LGTGSIPALNSSLAKDPVKMAPIAPGPLVLRSCYSDPKL